MLDGIHPQVSPILKDEIVQLYIYNLSHLLLESENLTVANNVTIFENKLFRGT